MVLTRAGLNMAKRKLHEPRYDFRQGRNSAVSPDLLNPSELVDATNARIDSVYGGFTKRTGTRRIHPTAVGAPSGIRGLIQWDQNSGTKQVVATAANGKLYHKTSALGDFTEVVPATLFSGYQTMTPFRDSGSGAALLLYIAGLGLYYFDGTTLTKSAAAGLPGNEDIVTAHATRLFLHSTSYKKSLFWSKVGTALDWTTTGVPTDPGNAVVDVLSGEAINALEIVGSSLLIGSEDSISRFTGYSDADIQIASDTRGIPGDMGPVGVFAFKRVENLVTFLAERGPYISTESEMREIGTKVEPDFLNITPANLAQAVVGYHRGRKEIWFAIPGASDGGLNKTVYVYSTRLQAWMGPWTYSFGITSFARYEDSNGAENLIAGCTDGFVRLMDDVGSYLDDRLSDGTGGNAITMTVETAPHFFETGAGFDKSLYRMELSANLDSASLTVKHAFDGAALTSVSVASTGSSKVMYRVDLSDYGKVGRIQFVDASTAAPTIYGYTLYAYDMQRQ
jgi:hypothetical protein